LLLLLLLLSLLVVFLPIQTKYSNRTELYQLFL